MMRDAHLRLVGLLLGCAGEGAVVVAGAASPWASLTYAGQHHRITFMLPAAAVDTFGRFAAGEPDLRGHLLVELAEVSRTPAGDSLLVHLHATTVEQG